MPALGYRSADYAHAHDLKFGLYSSNSPWTCGGHAGSQGYESIDAQTYADWGVDLLKYGALHTSWARLGSLAAVRVRGCGWRRARLLLC